MYSKRDYICVNYKHFNLFCKNIQKPLPKQAFLIKKKGFVCGLNLFYYQHIITRMA